MARELKLDIGSDAAAARANLAATARAVDHLADEADRLEKEFEQATRAAGKLDRQLLETKAAAAALSKEFTETGDKKLVAQIREQEKAAKEIQRIQKTIVGDSEKQATAARKAWSKLFDTFGDVGGHGSGFSGLPSRLVGALSDSGIPLVSTLAKHPALAAAAAPAIAGTAILAGATAGGLVTGGIGAGVAGAGIAGAAVQSDKVRAEWARATAEIKQDFLDATTGYEQPAIDAIKRVGGAIHEDANLKEIFGSAEKFVEPLADSTAKAIISIAHGFESLTSKAMPAVVALSNGITDVGKAIGIALDRIGDGSEGGAKALDDVFTAISDLIILTGTWIGWFEDAYGAVVRVTDGLREMHPFIGAVADEIDKATGNEKVSQLSGTLDHTASSADKATDSLHGLTGELSDMASEATIANTAFDRLFGIMMDVDSANIAVKLGLADLKTALKDEGTTRDELANKVLHQLQLLEDQRNAQLATGDGSQAATDRINANYRAQIEELKKMFPWLDGLIQKYEDLAKDRTAHIDIIIQEKRIGNVSVEGVVSGGDQRRNTGRGFASGTSYAPPGWAWAGENGPELINFGGGEKVLNNADSMRFAAPAGMSSTANAAVANLGGRTVTFAGNTDTAFATAVMRMFREGLITIN